MILSCNSQNERHEKSTFESTSPITLDRPKYRLQFPSAWSIDTTEEGYDIDSHFSLKPSSENAFCLFILFNTSLDEKEWIAGQVKAQLDKAMKHGEVSYFDRWGSFKGYGATVTGKIMGALDGNITTFCYSTDSLSFMVIRQSLDRYEKTQSPDFRLIESSFELKK